MIIIKTKIGVLQFCYDHNFCHNVDMVSCECEWLAYHFYKYLPLFFTIHNRLHQNCSKSCLHRVSLILNAIVVKLSLSIANKQGYHKMTILNFFFFKTKSTSIGECNTPQLLFYNPKHRKSTPSGFVNLKKFATYEQ